MSLDTNLSEFTAFDSDTDHPHDECGVFGVWAPDRDVARLTYFGLRALQHRGQESAGIAVGDGGNRHGPRRTWAGEPRFLQRRHLLAARSTRCGSRALRHRRR